MTNHVGLKIEEPNHIKLVTPTSVLSFDSPGRLIIFNVNIKWCANIQHSEMFLPAQNKNYNNSEPNTFCISANVLHLMTVASRLIFFSLCWVRLTASNIL